MTLGRLVRRSLVFYWRTGVVVVFGLASSTLLTLFVIPPVYGWLEARKSQPTA